MPWLSWQLLFSLLNLLTDPSELPTCIKDITANLRAVPDQKPELRWALDGQAGRWVVDGVYQLKQGRDGVRLCGCWMGRKQQVCVHVLSLLACLDVHVMSWRRHRLRLLCNLYNLLKSGSEERYNVLLSIIEFARDTKQVRQTSHRRVGDRTWLVVMTGTGGRG